MKLATIQLIADLRLIDGADRIEAATVLGYQTVIKRGEFRPGDRCVWHEPDTVAAERPEYEFLRKQGFRLKVSRFRGQVSQGLALPLAVLPPRASRCPVVTVNLSMRRSGLWRRTTTLMTCRSAQTLRR